MPAGCHLGPFYDGTRNGGSITLTARRGSSISTSVQLDYQNVQLPAGDFVRRLTGVKLAYFFTPRVFIQSLTQYNNAQRAVTANARLAWLRTGGTGLYVVLNGGEQAESFSRWQTPLSRSLTVKYAMQLGSGSGG